MYRSVGDDTNTALFTDDYMSQATQVQYAPLMLDPPKRGGAQTITANAVAPAAPPAPSSDASSSASMTSSPMGDSLVMWGLLGVVAVAGIYFFSRRG